MKPPRNAQFELLDLHARRVVGHARTLRGAGAAVDTLDSKHNGPRFGFRPIRRRGLRC